MDYYLGKYLDDKPPAHSVASRCHSDGEEDEKWTFLIFTYFSFKCLEGISPFLELLILLFWASGDVSSGFQGQGGFWLTFKFAWWEIQQSNQLH